MSLNFLTNTRSEYFSIIDPLSFNNFSDLQNQILLNSVKDSIGSTIAETFTKVMGGIDTFDTDSGNIASMIGNIASNILQENNISEDTFSFYKFRINPQRLKISRRKIIDEKLVGSGWDLDTVNEEMISIGYEGTTGSLVPYNFFNKTVEPLMRDLLSRYGGGVIGNITDSFVDIPVLNRNPKLSASYIKFLNFEQFWKYNNNDLLFVWEDNCYIGKFTDFSYNLSEKEPYQIMWSFNIKVYPDFKYNLYTGWIDEKQYKKIQQVFNRRFEETELLDNQDPKNIKSSISVIKGYEDKLTLEETDAISWFESLGKTLYNKNGKLFLENSNLNKGVDLSKITPRELAELYKENSNIDLFEDSIKFNLKNNVSEKNSIIENTASSQSGEDLNKIEKEVKSNYLPNP